MNDFAEAEISAGSDVIDWGGSLGRIRMVPGPGRFIWSNGECSVAFLPGPRPAAGEPGGPM